MRSEKRKTSLLGSLEQFFFAQQSPYGLALVRMFILAFALIPMLRRFNRVRELYSTDGAPQQLSQLFGQGNLLPVASASVAAALFGIMIFSMLCSILGFRTRLALFVGTTLYVYFNMLDAVSTMTKYAVISTHIMTILTFSNCGAVWSVDAILRRWKEGVSATAVPPQSPVWPARLIQILFCSVYFGAAITKIQTQAFFSGEQMRYWMLSNWNHDNPLGEAFAMWTGLLLACGYATAVWEISFPFLVWRPMGRFIALGVGILFHIGTWLTLGLHIFPLVCISGYLSFLMEEDIVALRRFVHRLRIPTSLLGLPRFAVSRLIEMRPASMSASILWVALAAFVAVASAEADYRIDLYGMRNVDGLMPLAQMDPEVARKMISVRRPVREKDKFFSFDIGTLTVGGQLSNRLQQFEFGETIIAQCNLNTPHDDLWVECVVEDDQQRIIDSSGLFVARESLFACFKYEIGNKLVPGEYWMVLKSSGNEVARRPFTLTGDPQSLPTMSDFVTN
jgi:hypothetical protein